MPIIERLLARRVMQAVAFARGFTVANLPSWSGDDVI